MPLTTGELSGMPRVGRLSLPLLTSRSPLARRERRAKQKLSARAGALLAVAILACLSEAGPEAGLAVQDAEADNVRMTHSD